MPSVDVYENFLKRSQAVAGGGHLQGLTMPDKGPEGPKGGWLVSLFHCDSFFHAHFAVSRKETTVSIGK